MTKPALAKLCAVWQERLLLQDWTILVEFDKALDSWGHAEWTDLYRHANIKIHPDGPEGIEFYLVHELIHLRVGKIGETRINLLARAFMKAYHRKKRS